MDEHDRWIAFAVAALSSKPDITPRDAASIADQMEVEFANRWRNHSDRGWIKTRPEKPRP